MQIRVRYEIVTRTHVAQTVQDFVVIARFLQMELVARKGGHEQVGARGAGGDVVGLQDGVEVFVLFDKQYLHQSCQRNYILLRNKERGYGSVVMELPKKSLRIDGQNVLPNGFISKKPHKTALIKNP
uniref:Uncharacterized protein n=1 Tax=Romanomermis culicivorax TaxID=13658 RepID=A0A915L832_ROMCU